MTLWMKKIEVKGKRVLVRCDFNEPFSDGKLDDNWRIQKSLETIKYLVNRGAKVILMSHFGRPGGEKIESLNLSLVQEELVKLLGMSVTLANGCIGKEIERWTYEMQEGEVLLLENLRFRKGEINNNKRFAKRLARLGDIYINEAFSASHREHASIVRLPKLLPSYLGLLLEKEVESLSDLFEREGRIVGVVGGSKVKKKLESVPGLLGKVDRLLVGGLVGMHLEESDGLVLPVDTIKEGGRVADIGGETVSLFRKEVKEAKTVFWVGPLGDIREERFSGGTMALAQAIVEVDFSVVGGGDTVDFLRDQGLEEEFDFVSTGGGAMLKFLADGTLPGLEALGWKR